MVDPTSCREWRGAITSAGYGTVHRGGRTIYVHRHAWELANGPIPDGLCVLHACDNPACFRLDHLSLGTHAENLADMAAKGRSWAGRMTHCKRGHEFTSENTYIIPASGSRVCRACRPYRDHVLPLYG